MSEKPVCLECQCLVWQGFLGHCRNILIDDSLLDEATELAEARAEGKSEKELALIEQQHACFLI